MWVDDYRLFMLPWAALLTLICAVPVIVELRRPRVDLFSPPVFVSVSHVLPSIIIGSVAVAFGFRSGFDFLVPSPRETYALTLAYTCIGYLALFVGYYHPLSQRAGAVLAARLPRANWTAAEIFLPGLALLAMGIALQLTAFATGLLGFQITGTVGTYDAALVISALAVTAAGTILLWLVVFDRGLGAWSGRLALATIATWTLIDVLSSGRRGATLQAIVYAAGAFWLSGRRVRLRHAMFAGTAAVLALVVGMAYGTTFRLVKGSQSRLALSEYLPLAIRSAQITLDRGVGENVTFVARHLTERLAEMVGTMSVIIGTYEQMAPFEKAVGLEQNIVRSLEGAFIPRALWPDKPIVGEPRNLGLLYLRYPNAFAITPVGDLIRNFGPLGIPVGMAIIGVILRLLYRTFIEAQPPEYWRTTAYLLLLPCVNMESYFAVILPTLVRTSAVVAACLLFVAAIVAVQRGVMRRLSPSGA